jgi:hypothetical protein
MNIVRMMHPRENRLIPHAYVLITVEKGCLAEIKDIIGSIPEVRNIYVLSGIFDLLVEIEAPYLYILRQIIKSKIRLMKDVRTTITLIEEKNLADDIELNKLCANLTI